MPDCATRPHPVLIHYRILLLNLGRVLVYLGLTALIFLVIYVDALTIGTFGETSLVEICQSVLLAVMSGLLLYGAVTAPHLRTSAILLLGFTFSSLIRENDVWLDLLHPEGWELLAFPVVAAALAYAWYRREVFLEELKVYTESVSFGLLISALSVTYVFSRLFGMGRFWQLVMGDNFDRNIKDMSEECIELLGYGLLLFAVLEFLHLARRLAAPPP